MRKSVLVMALLALSGSAFAADDASKILSGSKLKEAVSGKTIYLMTPIGAEIPIRYQPNGTMTGRISASLAALGGEKASDSGRWWVVREQLCQQWNSWSDSRSHCYKLRTDGGKVTWRRNDGETGTARIASN